MTAISADKHHLFCRRIINNLSVHKGLKYLDVSESVGLSGHDIAVKDTEVGKFALFYGALKPLHLVLPGTVDGVSTDCFLPGDNLIGTAYVAGKALLVIAAWTPRRQFG